MSRLDNKVAIVTGGTQGLGEAIAREAAAAGAAGMVLVGRNRERGERVARDLSSAGCKAVFSAAELARPEDCRAVIDHAEGEFGRLDALVNAAAFTGRGHLEDTTVEFWNTMFDVNARAPFLLMQGAARLMRERGRGGAIVNIITTGSHGGMPYIMAYCASKGALAVLTRNVAHALRRDRIRVLGLNIGWTDTPNEHIIQTQTHGRPENWLEEVEAEQPFGQLIKPAEVAKMVRFLLSDDAGVMTGSLIDYDQNVLGTRD